MECLKALKELKSTFFRHFVPHVKDWFIKEEGLNIDIGMFFEQFTHLLAYCSSAF